MNSELKYVNKLNGDAIDAEIPQIRFPGNTVNEKWKLWNCNECEKKHIVAEFAFFTKTLRNSNGTTA